MKDTLNNLYSIFLSGEMNLADFESCIYEFLVSNKEKTGLCHWKQEDYEDFISWFYPRLKIAIETYNDIGASFEAFMSKYLLISAKEYHVRKTINSVTEYSAWSARVPEMYAREESPVYIHNDAQNVINQLLIDKKGRKSSKRILALVLKCYYYVSDDFAEKIAPLIGINKNELLKMLSVIRKKRQEKDDNIYLMKERIYRQFYKCIIYEKRLTMIKENTSAYNKLNGRLARARQRLEKMRKRLAGIRKEASNSQIAEVIGITKGTVDASLCRLKIKWEKLSKNADLN